MVTFILFQSHVIMKRNIVKGAVSHSYCFSFYYCNFFRLKRLYRQKKISHKHPSPRLQHIDSITCFSKFIFMKQHFTEVISSFSNSSLRSYIVFFKLVS